MKHTSGEWQWDGNVWDYNQEQEAPWLKSSTGEIILSGQIICKSEADAQLIAAAPELLEALYQTLSVLDLAILQTPSGLARDRFFDLNILVNAAIKKATT